MVGMGCTETAVGVQYESGPERIVAATSRCRTGLMFSVRATACGVFRTVRYRTGPRRPINTSNLKPPSHLLAL